MIHKKHISLTRRLLATTAMTAFFSMPAFAVKPADGPVGTLSHSTTRTASDVVTTYFDTLNIAPYGHITLLKPTAVEQLRAENRATFAQTLLALSESSDSSTKALIETLLSVLTPLVPGKAGTITNLGSAMATATASSSTAASSSAPVSASSSAATFLTVAEDTAYHVLLTGASSTPTAASSSGAAPTAAADGSSVPDTSGLDKDKAAITLTALFGKPRTAPPAAPSPAVPSSSAAVLAPSTDAVLAPSTDDGTSAPDTSGVDKDKAAITLTALFGKPRMAPHAASSTPAASSSGAALVPTAPSFSPAPPPPPPPSAEPSDRSLRDSSSDEDLYKLSPQEELEAFEELEKLRDSARTGGFEADSDDEDAKVTPFASKADEYARREEMMQRIRLTSLAAEKAAFEKARQDEQDRLERLDIALTDRGIIETYEEMIKKLADKETKALEELKKIREKLSDASTSAASSSWFTAPISYVGSIMGLGPIAEEAATKKAEEHARQSIAKIKAEKTALAEAIEKRKKEAEKREKEEAAALIEAEKKKIIEARRGAFTEDSASTASSMFSAHAPGPSKSAALIPLENKYPKDPLIRVKPKVGDPLVPAADLDKFLRTSLKAMELLQQDIDDAILEKDISSETKSYYEDFYKHVITVLDGLISTSKLEKTEKKPLEEAKEKIVKSYTTYADDATDDDFFKTPVPGATGSGGASGASGSGLNPMDAVKAKIDAAKARKDDKASSAASSVWE